MPISMSTPTWNFWILLSIWCHVVLDCGCTLHMPLFRTRWGWKKWKRRKEDFRGLTYIVHLCIVTFCISYRIPIESKILFLCIYATITIGWTLISFLNYTLGNLGYFETSGSLVCRLDLLDSSIKFPRIRSCISSLKIWVTLKLPSIKPHYFLNQ